MRRTLLTILTFVSLTASADLIDEAKKLMATQDWWGAAETLAKEAKANPKIASSGQFLYLSGVCQYETGNYAKAKELLKAAKGKNYSAANLYLGRLAFLDYDFTEATDYYEAYRKHIEKSKGKESPLLDEFETQLANAESSLSRVEKIEIIDSLAVPAESFLQHYILPSSAGRILGPEEIPFPDKRDGAVSAFSNEGGDFMMWGAYDSKGHINIMESVRLTDGEWQEPVAAPAILGDGGNADYPFMMTDGTTLYYASDGKGSIGGYDIFVVSRDPQTGEYLHPQNLGMPFNSPYDDFMLAIDEENGIGWWATDRNLLGDKLTVYVYKTNDLRKNYDADSPDIIEKARISDFRSTRTENVAKEYKEILSSLKNAPEISHAPKAEFHLPVDNGKFLTRMEELPAGAQASMKTYLLASESLRKEEERLEALRRRYAEKRADNVRMQIIQFEKEIEQKRAEVVGLRSEVYKNLRK